MDPAGNILTSPAPSRLAVRISLGVAAPGMTPRSRSTDQVITSGFTSGATMNWAPAATAASAKSTVVTVPAPMVILPAMSRRKAAIMSSNPAVLAVTSIKVTPPR